MRRYNSIFLIQIVIIYTGIGSLYTHNPDPLTLENEELTLTSIKTTAFTLQWNQDPFPGNGSYIVNVTGICTVEHSCDKEVSLCKFDSSEQKGTCASLSFALKSCQNITVVVIGESKEWNITFNLAPALDFSVQLTHNETTAYLSWKVPESNPSNECATRARAILHVDKNVTNSLPFQSNFEEVNTYNMSLPECAHGQITATLIYLTRVEGYDTETGVKSGTDPEIYKGLGGVSDVSISVLPEDCSITANWDGRVTCVDDVSHYIASWYQDTSAIDANEVDSTTDSIKNREADSYKVSVQAFWSDDGDEMGNPAESDSEELDSKEPETPTDLKISSNNKTPTELSVTWNQPSLDICAGEVTEYTITYQEGENIEEISTKSTTILLSNLMACTNYTVSLKAIWESGVLAAGKMTKRTGSTDPSKPILTITSFDASSMTLDWKYTDVDSCPLSGYIVTWTPGTGDDSGGNTDVEVSLTTKIENLTCNTKYTVIVIANANDGKSNTSEKGIETTDDLAPGATTVTGVSAVDDNPNQLTVTWSEPNYTCAGDLGDYKVSWTVDGEDGPTDAPDKSGTEATISGLEPCTPYIISVAATSNTGIPGVPGTSTNVTSVGVPGTSSGISKESSYTPYSLDVNWSPPPTIHPGNPCTITNYTVEWSNSSSEGSQSGIISIPHTIPDLIACTEYKITVIAYTDKGPGKPSIPEPLTTDTAVPGISTNLTQTSVTSNSIEVNWSPPVDSRNPCTITKYTVEWVSSSGETGQDDTVTKPPHNITGLIACTDYSITVIAHTEKGPGEHGVTVPATTDKDVPGTSSGISKESSYTPHSLDVNWSAPPTTPPGNPCTITNYTVEWSSSSGGGSQSGVTSIPHTIPNLIACREYDITVIAYTDKGPGNSSIPETLTTDTAVPGISTNLTQRSATANSVELNWSPPVNSSNPCDITKYTVDWVSSNGETGQNDTVTKPPYNITGLIACTDYDITVIAHTKKGPGDPSDTVSFTTDIDVPGISTNISRIDYTPYSLELTWNPPPNTTLEGGNPCLITNYTVQCTNSSDEADGITETVTEPHLSITGLDACTDYYITVIAYTEKGSGKSSAIKKMATGVDAPKVDEDKVNIASTSRAAQVNWEKPDTSCNLTYNVEHRGNTLWTNNQTSDPGKTQTIDDPIHSATLDELLPYSKYDVCVTVNNNINGEKTCKTFTTEEAVPSAPRNVSVDGFDDVSLTLTWDYPEAENGILLNYVVSWGMEGESSNNYTVDADDITSHTIYELEDGNYFFSVRAVNNKGSSGQSDSIEQEMNGPTACGGGCIAGIVIGILLVALAIPAFIFRDRIMHTIKPGPPPVEESPYELRGAAILKSDFRRHVEELGLDRAERAYQMLNDESQQKTKFAAAKPFNKGKNRFANIHPFDETRVKLQLMRNGPKGSDYINANHITFPDTFTLKFTATQGPLDSTINDFWRMIWEHKVYDTVMLCNLFEKGKSKCAQYWTENGERSMEFGDFKISCQAEEEDMSKTFITRYIDVVKDGQHRMVKQHHFLAWPDFGVPENEEGLLRFLASVKRNVNEHGTNVLTHCSAGVGRTGTFIALWVLTSLLEQNKSAKSIDVHQISLMMREGRSDMIQTKDQYLYLHKCLLKYMEDTGNSFPISNKDDEEPIYGNVNTAYQQ